MSKQYRVPLTVSVPNATTATRWVGGTASGAPAAGTWVTGDWAVAQNGHIWICTAGGTPGTWVDVGATGNLVTSVAGRTGAVTLTAADIAAGTFPGASYTFTGTNTATAQIASGLTGATTATRYVGGTATVAPTTGTFVAGDFVISQNAKLWVCTVGGSPGTWVAATTATSATTVTAMNSFGLSSVVGTSGNFAREDHVHSTPSTPVTSWAGRTGVVTATAADIAAGTFPAGNFIMSGNLSIGSGTYTGWTFTANAPGASTATRYVGGTTTGPPTSGTWVAGDFVFTQDGFSWICTTGGTPGTWQQNGNPMWKAPVRAASTVNVTVASALVNGLVMDGVTLVTGDRVLLKNQTTGAENGIYIVVASGAAPRAGDADTAAKVWGMRVPVLAGTVATAFEYVNTNTTSPTLGTTALTFAGPAGTADIADIAATESAGTSTNIPRGDHVHALPALGAWTAYTPSWTSSGTAPALGNGSLAGLYVQFGKTVHYRIAFTAGSTTTFGTGSYLFSLPVAGNTSQAAPIGYGIVVDAGVGRYLLVAFYNTSTTVNMVTQVTAGLSPLVGNTSPITFGNADQIFITGTYEVP